MRWTLMLETWVNILKDKVHVLRNYSLNTCDSHPTPQDLEAGARAVAHLVECLPSIQNKLGTVAYIYNPSD